MLSGKPYIICLWAVLFALPALAQHPGPMVGTRVDIQVKATFDDGRTPASRIILELLDGNWVAQQRLITDDKGRVDFAVDVNLGSQFHIRATGDTVEETVSERISVQPNEGTHMVYLTVKAKEGAPPPSAAAGAVTSVAHAQAPKAAQNAVRDGLKEWEKKDYPQAAADFEKATTLYPQYDEAFNYLGMTYSRLDQPEKSRAAFEAAVKLNDKNPSADRNLAGLLIRDRDYKRAAELAQKSLALEPNNAVSLTILAIAELQLGNFSDAVKYARQAHDAPHEGYALSHFVAGQALERQMDPNGAKVEYQIYLKEAPDGPEAPKVKQALARLVAAGPQ